MSVRQGKNIISGRSTIGVNLLDYKWADHLLNDMSWLRADTFSWQSGDVYKAAYEHLYNDYIEVGISSDNLYRDRVDDIIVFYWLAKDGHKIAVAGQEAAVQAMYKKTGVAWYYILDTKNKQFKLPRTKFGFTGLRDEVGGYVPESLPNIRAESSGTGLFKGGGGSFTGAFVMRDGPNEGIYGSGGGTYFGVDFDASLSSPTYQDNAPVQERATQMYLYFYVGNFERDAVEQTAGLNAELFNQKMDNSIPLIRDIFSPEEWENGSMEQILSAGAGTGDLVFTKNWQEYDYLWFSSVSDSSSTLDDSPHWLNVKWMLAQAKAGVTNLAVVRYSSGSYWYVNPQEWTTTTMPRGSQQENLFINKVYGIKLKNITAQNVGLLNYKGLFETAAALVATVPTAMGQWAIVSNDETQGGLQTKYFSTKDVNGNFVWAFGGVIDSSLVGCDYVVESQLPTEANGYTWYRKYKSGWVEQGGMTTNSTNSVTLPVEMSDTNYTVIRTIAEGYSTQSYYPAWVAGYNTRTTTGFTFGMVAPNNIWQVCGMAAQ